MKLYTEEQVRNAIELARDTHQEGLPYLETDEYDYSMDEVVDLLTPIELPSDEEIDNKLDSIDKYHIMKDFYCDGFKDCAKYIIDKIQGGNK